VTGEQSVIVERRADGTATVRLNRPQVKNALNTATREALAAAFAALAEDPAVRAVVLTGGSHDFAAGADINEFVDETTIGIMRKGDERAWAAIARLPQPLIAAVNGYALGGGMELAMSCDIIVAGESAKFGQPEVRIGIIPGAGGTQRLPRAVGKFHAMRLILTGDVVSASEALTMGLISRVVEDAAVETEAQNLASRIAALPPLAVQAAKQAVLMSESMPLEAGLQLERRSFERLFASSDKREGMRAFLDKRPPRFTGD
jgi:enoyl-CoA hydratase/carnithine racemase